MLRRFWNRISSFPLWQRMRTGRTPYIITTAALLISTLLVYFDPRSVLAFLLFMASVSLIYVMPLNRGFRIGAGLIVALILIPVIGMRNIFYLEVIFQISVFAALALGLNIVVGFTGLLNLGYVAFYAVGAYLWAFFGSQQLLPAPRHPRFGAARHAISSCRPIPSTCSCSWAGHRRRGWDPAGAAGAARARRLPGHRHPGVWRSDPRVGQQPG